MDLKKNQASLWNLLGSHCTLHAAALVDPRRFTYVHTRTLPVRYWCLAWCIAWICMRPNQLVGGSPENLQLSRLRYEVLYEQIVRVRVYAYATRELWIFGMLPTNVLRDATEDCPHTGSYRRQCSLAPPAPPAPPWGPMYGCRLL